MRLVMLSWRYCDHPASGGAEVLTHEILKRLVSAGHIVTCFTAAYPGCEPRGEIDGVKLVRDGAQWSVHIKAWRWLRRRLHDVDLVVDQVNTIPFCTPLYVPADQRRLFIHQLARGYWFRETRGVFRIGAPLGYALEPSLLRIYRQTPAITVSESSRADLVRLGLKPERIVIIPEALKDPPLETLGEKDLNAPRLVMLGRLTPAKFVEEGIRCFGRLQRELPDAQLDVVGSGPPHYKRRLEAMIARDGIQGVTFHGRVDEDRKRALLAAAHVHVFTSHREGWGLVVSEAAAVGTPSVGYDAPGVRDSIGDPRLLAPIGDIERLSDRLATVLKDRRLYEQVRENSWRRTQSMTYEAATRAFAAALGVKPELTQSAI